MHARVLRDGFYGDGYGTLHLRIMPLLHRRRIVSDFDAWRNTQRIDRD